MEEWLSLDPNFDAAIVEKIATRLQVSAERVRAGRFGGVVCSEAISPEQATEGVPISLQDAEAPCMTVGVFSEKPIEKDQSYPVLAAICVAPVV